MAYGLQFKVSIVWIPDGTGQMEVPSAQVLTVTEKSPSGGGIVAVPGANAPSTANISTACTSMATAAAAALNLNISQIQGFASGNP